jgi:hypothetical protein
MPHFLRQLWYQWQRLARRIGEWQSRVILTVLYLFLIGPLTLIVRIKDPLGVRHSRRWQPCHSRSADLPAARRQ